MRTAIRSILGPTLAALPLVLGAVCIAVCLGCGGTSPFTPGAEQPPGNTTPTSTFGASGSFISGPNAGKAFTITFKNVPSEGVPVLTGTLEILGNQIPIIGTIDPNTHDWKMTGTDKATGVTYTADFPPAADGTPSYGNVTDSQGGKSGLITPRAQ